MMIDPFDPTRRKRMPKDAKANDLLEPIMRNGEIVYASPKLTDIRAHTMSQLASFHGGVKRSLNPHRYPMGLEMRLNDLRTKLILEARERTNAET